MGDAGPLTPSAVREQQDVLDATRHGPSDTIREIHILVTGFGAFKSFTTNPSYLITRSLPTVLQPHTAEDAHFKYLPSSMLQGPVRAANPSPYIIKVHAHPTPLRVAYASTATYVPRLIRGPISDAHDYTHASESVANQGDSVEHYDQYDYVLHIGVAGGRDNYTLEIQAFRDHYKIKDVDDRDGFISGEYNWKREGCPDVLEVGWDKDEVLTRWERLTDKAEQDYEHALMMSMGFDGHALESPSIDAEQRDNYRRMCMLGKGRRAVVKLSEDAGRFLCEFILYTSLSTRWKEARAETNDNDDVDDNYDDNDDESRRAIEVKHEDTQGNDAGRTDNSSPAAIRAAPAPSGQALAADVSDLAATKNDQSPGLIEKAGRASERVGKIAFLHVPGGIQEHDIARGARVAQAAILSVVGSWEDGYRNHNIHRKA